MDGITIREARPDDCTHLLDLWQLVSSGSPITDTVAAGTCGAATSIGWPFIQSEDIVELRAPSYRKSRAGGKKGGGDGFMPRGKGERGLFSGVRLFLTRQRPALSSEIWGGGEGPPPAYRASAVAINNNAY